MVLLVDFPEELLRKIIGMLSLPDRARAETVSKQFLQYSLEDVDAVKTYLPVGEDPIFLDSWLMRLGRKSVSRLQKLILMSHEPYCIDSLGLSKFHNLAYLDLISDAPYGLCALDNDLSNLGRLTKLKHLAFGYECTPADESSYNEDFREFSDLVHLQYLRVCFRPRQSKIDLSSKLTGMRNLTALKFEGDHSVVLSDTFAQLTPALRLLHFMPEYESQSQKVFEALQLTSLDAISCAPTRIPFNLSGNLKELVWREVAATERLLDNLRSLRGLTALLLETLASFDLSLLMSSLTGLKKLTMKPSWPEGCNLLSPYTVLSRLTSLDIRVDNFRTGPRKIQFYRFLCSREHMGSLKKLAIRLCVPFRLEADLSGLSNLEELEFTGAIVITSMVSEKLSRLSICTPPSSYTTQGRSSGIPSICADFMRGICCLEKLQWDILCTETEEAIWLAASMTNLDRLTSLHLTLSADFATTSAEGFLLDLIPALGNLRSLDTLEIDAPSCEMILKRSFIPSVRRLAIHCSALTMCLSCTMSNLIVIHTEEHVYPMRFRRCPGLRVFSNSSGTTIIKYNELEEVWRPVTEVLIKKLADFLG